LKPELLISTDVETLGRVPGLHHMISIGAAAIDPRGGEVRSRFSVNLEQLPDKVLTADPETVRWWMEPGKEEAWKRSTEGAIHPEYAMWAFRSWLGALQQSCELTFLAKPAAFDMGFIQYYLHRFTGGSPFERWRSYDLHSLMSAITGIPVNEVKTENLPADLLEGLDKGLEHTGIADAIYQGLVAVRCLDRLRQMRSLKLKVALNAEAQPPRRATQPADPATVIGRLFGGLFAETNGREERTDAELKEMLERVDNAELLAARGPMRLIVIGRLQ
jgi:hypothetical protein